jgi:hypothetical protein
MIAVRVVRVVMMTAHLVVVLIAVMIAVRVVRVVMMTAHLVVVLIAVMIAARVEKIIAPLRNDVLPKFMSALVVDKLAVVCRIRLNVRARIGLMKAQLALCAALRECALRQLVVHKKVVARKFAH